MTTAKYDLVFRIPEDIIGPNATELMLRGGYNLLNLVFIHGVPNVEVYITQKDAEKAGINGLEIYSSESKVRRLIEKGDQAVKDFGSFISDNPSKNFKKQSNNELEKIRIGIYNNWISFNFVYSFTEFIYFHKIEKDLRSWIEQKEKNPQKANEILHQLLSCSDKEKYKRDIVINSIELPAQLRIACNSVTNISRKKLSWRNFLNGASVYTDSFNRELARRFFMSTGQIKSCFHKDLLALLRGKKIDIQEINNRRDYVICMNKASLCVYIGRQAQNKKRKIVKKNKDKIKELRGDVVCRGKVRGRAIKFTFGFSKAALKEIDEKISKMTSGDILVTESTGPELIMACRKAAAIITEEGGINSHAAVISRELKIPAIVNTKIATQVINDGDLLDVDAENGIIKIIS